MERNLFRLVFNHDAVRAMALCAAAFLGNSTPAVSEDNALPCGFDKVPPAPEISRNPEWHGGAIALKGLEESVLSNTWTGHWSVRPESHQQSPQDFDLDMRVLVLSATRSNTSEPGLRLIRENLEGLGIPYTHVHLTRDGVRLSSGKLDLEYEPEGDPNRPHGRYMGIVLTSDLVAYQDNEGTWHSSLTPEQWAQLAAYEAKYHVRRVAVSAFPRPTYGVEPAGEPQTAPNALLMQDAAKEFSSGLVANARMPLKGSYQNPARIVDPTLATPVALFENQSTNGIEKPVAATISRYTNGREQLNFYFAQSPYLSASFYNNVLWVNWLTRGVYQGRRRIYLNLQVDDLFMPNGMWHMDLRLAPSDGYREYRITTDDLQELVSWQRSFQQRLPSGSTFKIEMIPNGKGVWEARGYAHDPLFRAARKIIPEFHWVSHTFSHPDLDRISSKRLTEEIQSNRSFMDDLIGEHTEYFSPHSLVTPHISGLFNKEALRALYENGIYNVVGDNSRRELWPLHHFHGFFTAARTNGFEGIFVIPRQATVAPVSAGPVEYLRSFYNNLYTGFWGRELASSEIMQLEAERVSKLLMSWRHDPYMFHQGNLWFFDWPDNPGSDNRNRHSLLSLWIEFVADEISRYMTLPLLSAKMDDMAGLLQKRMELDRCGVNMTLSIDALSVKRVNVHTESHCDAPVTGLVLAGSTEDVKLENYGPDRTSIIRMKAAGHATFEVMEAVNWASHTGRGGRTP